MAPHLALLAEQAELLVDSNPLLTKAHHESGATFQQKREDEVFALTETTSQFGNPFDDDGSVLLNIVTKKVLPKDAKEDLVNCATIGERLHKTFVKERIESSTVNFWSRMIMTKLKRWKSNNKTVKVKTAEAKVIELTEDQALFGRMAIISESRPELNMNEIIGEFELSVAPRSMFAADGSMHHCSAKSKLMKLILEKIKTAEITSLRGDHEKEGSVAIIDGMAEVQVLEKTDDVRSCADLAFVSTNSFFEKYQRYEILYFLNIP